MTAMRMLAAAAIASLIGAGFSAQALAPAADDHALVGFAFHNDGGRDAAQLALVFPFVDDDGGRVGQFVAGEAEFVPSDTTI